jgi:hypothetical protein
MAVVKHRKTSGSTRSIPAFWHVTDAREQDELSSKAELGTARRVTDEAHSRTIERINAAKLPKSG